MFWGGGRGALLGKFYHRPVVVQADVAKARGALQICLSFDVSRARRDRFRLGVYPTKGPHRVQGLHVPQEFHINIRITNAASMSYSARRQDPGNTGMKVHLRKPSHVRTAET